MRTHLQIMSPQKAMPAAEVQPRSGGGENDAPPSWGPLVRLCNRSGSPTVRSCLLLLVLCCVLPAALGAALFIVQAYWNGRVQLQERAMVLSRTVLTEVEERVRNATAALQVLATSPALEESDLAAFHAQALKALTFQPGNTYVLSSLEGQQLVNALVPFGRALPQHGNAPLQRRVIDQGRPAVSDLFLGPVARKPLVAVEVPVVLDGRLVYTLAMGIFPERFTPVLVNLQPEPDWVIAVFDRTGTVLARTHNTETFIGRKGSPGLLEAMARTVHGVAEVDTLEGTPVLAAYTRSSTTGWTVAVGIPRQLLLSRLQRWIATLAVASLAVLSLALIVAVTISRRISEAIDALVAPAEALGRGEPVSAARLPLREADVVASALARASTLLQSRTQERDQATRDTEAARTEARRMEHAASHDPLTDLPNRLHFEHLLAQRLQTCRERGGALSVLFADLDDFKPVNDIHGHQMGDKLLRSFAVRLLSGVRSSDTVARLGGDEFAVLLEELPRHEAQHVAQGLRERLSMPYAIDHVQLYVGASIGVAGYPEDGDTAEALLAAADAAMYSAKASGKAHHAVPGRDLVPKDGPPDSIGSRR